MLSKVIQKNNTKCIQKSITNRDRKCKNEKYERYLTILNNTNRQTLQLPIERFANEKLYYFRVCTHFKCDYKCFAVN